MLTSNAVSGGVYVGENSAEILAVSVAEIAQYLVLEGVEFRQGLLEHGVATRMTARAVTRCAPKPLRTAVLVATACPAAVEWVVTGQWPTPTPRVEIQWPAPGSEGLPL